MIHLSRVILALVLALPAFGAAALADGDLATMRSADLLRIINQNPATTITAYSLTTRSSFTRGLADACRAGHHVIVVLNRDPMGYARADNNRSEALLTAAGCQVTYSDRLFGDRQMHLKMTFSGRSMFLSDTNYSVKGYRRARRSAGRPQHRGGNAHRASGRQRIFRDRQGPRPYDRGGTSSDLRTAVRSQSRPKASTKARPCRMRWSARRAHTLRCVCLWPKKKRRAAMEPQVRWPICSSSRGWVSQVRLGNANEKIALIPGGGLRGERQCDGGHSR